MTSSDLVSCQKRQAKLNSDYSRCRNAVADPADTMTYDRIYSIHANAFMQSVSRGASGQTEFFCICPFRFRTQFFGMVDINPAVPYIFDTFEPAKHDKHI